MNVKHPFLCIWLCLSSPRPEKEGLLICSPRTASMFHTTESWKISAKLGEAVVCQYVEDGVVCPPSLRTKLFTTSAVDNIDHNPSSTTAKTSFHGTSISICQHPRPDYAGELREAPRINDHTNSVKRVPELPESFTHVRPAHIAKNPTPHKEVSLTLPSPTFIQSHLRNNVLGWNKCG